MSRLDVSIHDRLETVEPLWRSAEGSLAGSPFHAFDLLRCWAMNLPGNNALSWRIVVVRDAEGVLLILPLYLRRRHGLNLLGSMGDDVSDYTGPLVSPRWFEHCPAGGFEPFLRSVLPRLGPVDLLVLRRVPRHICALPNPYADLGGAEPGLTACATALPASFEAYLDRKRRKVHLDTERQVKRLSQLGEVVYERVEAPDDIRSVVEQMLSQKEQRFALDAARDTPEHRAYVRRYYTAMGALRAPGCEGHVSRLRVGGEVVATHVGLIRAGCFHYIMPGFAAGEWARYSPGRVLLEKLLRESIERGLTTFDMTIGDEGYKRIWVDQENRLIDIHQGQSLAGRAYCAARRWARKARRKLPSRQPAA